MSDHLCTVDKHASERALVTLPTDEVKLLYTVASAYHILHFSPSVGVPAIDGRERAYGAIYDRRSLLAAVRGIRGNQITLWTGGDGNPFTLVLSDEKGSRYVVKQGMASDVPVDPFEGVKRLLARPGAIHAFHDDCLIVTVAGRSYRLPPDLLSAGQWFALLSDKRKRKS